MSIDARGLESEIRRLQAVERDHARLEENAAKASSEHNAYVLLRDEQVRRIEQEWANRLGASQKMNRDLSGQVGALQKEGSMILAENEILRAMVKCPDIQIKGEVPLKKSWMAEAVEGTSTKTIDHKDQVIRNLQTMVSSYKTELAGLRKVTESQKAVSDRRVQGVVNLAQEMDAALAKFVGLF